MLLQRWSSYLYFSSNCVVCGTQLEKRELQKESDEPATAAVTLSRAPPIMTHNEPYSRSSQGSFSVDSETSRRHSSSSESEAEYVVSKRHSHGVEVVKAPTSDDGCIEITIAVPTSVRAVV